MKRLLAMLLALLTSLFQGVNYQASDVKPYAPTAYYKIDPDSKPDYRALYDSTYMPNSNTSSCRTTNYSSNGRLISYGTTTVPETGYWFIDDATVDITDDSLKANLLDLSAGNGEYLICPYDAVLCTNSANNKGHDMKLKITLDSVDYELYFEEMERWYCCMARQNPVVDSSGNTIWIHTSDEQYGHIFKQGNVLGRASDKTKVTITCTTDSNLSTFESMYKNAKPQ